MEGNEKNKVHLENEEKILSKEPIASKKHTDSTKEKTQFYKKWWFWLIIGLVILTILFSGGDSRTSDGTDDQGIGSSQSSSDRTNLGDYHVDILSCRVVRDYDNKKVVIVKYKFTNYSDESANFSWSISDDVFQNGVELNNAYLLPDEANYNTDNKTKNIKTGVSIEVEVAYELNDTTTPIEIELTEIFGWSNDKVIKTFTLN